MRRLALALALCALAALAAAPGASASFGLESFDVGFAAGPEGPSDAQAGSHPFSMTTSFRVNTEDVGGELFPQEAVKDLELLQVRGFAGDQTAVRTCSISEFLTEVTGSSTGCSDSTAIGIAHLVVGTGLEEVPLTTPLYNLTPSFGKAAKIGFFVLQVPVTVDVGITQTPPYRLIASSRNISQALEFYEGTFTLWGVPADPAHDEERGACYEGGESCPAGVAPRPFLTLPRSCEGPLASEYELDSWQHPGAWVRGQALSHDDAVPPNPQGMLGCGKLGFAPATSARPSTAEAESSAGIDFTIDVEDEGLKNPEGIAEADIAKVITRLPAGVTANPSAAEGLGVCTEAQLQGTTMAAQGCPEASKLGSVQVQTPLLEDHPLHGAAFLGAQRQNAAGGLVLPLYLVVKDEELGILIKQEGRVEPDPASGRLVSTFEGLPSFPLSHVEVQLRSGPRAPLITPPTCGTYATETELFPSSGASPITSTSTFQVSSGPGGGPCPGGAPPLAPGFEAGSANNAAGVFSPFSMRLTRADGEQDLTRFSATLPPGIVPKLAGVAKCPDAAIAAARSRSGRQELASPSCPASSLIGQVTGGAGVGTALTYVPGSVYLAGPFGGDPLSAVAIVPAVAGPFDLGTVVTRVALTVNPTTYLGEIDGAASDPIPHMLEGLPLKLRSLEVAVDRPQFMLTPTGCRTRATTALIGGAGADPFNPADDTAVGRSSRYQAASCSSLAFRPHLRLAFRGGTRRGAHPALRSTLTYPPGRGYANTGRAVVVLPHSEFIDQAHINNPCTRVQFNAGACPRSSVLGTARAITPLLDEPLEGPVYFRSNGGERKLPDVVADLHGLVHIVLVGKVDSTHARIRTTFDELPDAPVAKFTLSLHGGKRGLLINSANLCAAKRRAKVTLKGQNGAAQITNPVISTGCSKKHRKRSRRHRPR